MNSHVFRSFDPYLEREIAIKEIEKAKFGNDFSEYCLEARTMFAASHPNIIDIEYVCETPDHICFALPYFANGSLKAKIKSGPLSSRDFLKVAQGVLSGLAHIHSLGFVHLDLKPSNILFTDNGTPLVADFGQSRRLGNTGTVKFPAIYRWLMPPEVLINHVATIESDIFQIGCLLYRSVNGEAIYQEQKATILDEAEFRKQILRGLFPDSRFFLPHIPKRIRTIIRKALRPDPTERYNSASELAANLGRVPIHLDWNVTPLSGGGGDYSWRASRPENPDLEVELKKVAPAKWQTRVWTVRGSDRRAKNKASYWATGLNYTDALTHLTDVFADLSQ